MNKIILYECFLEELKLKNYTGNSIISLGSHLKRFFDFVEQNPDIDCYNRIGLFLDSIDSPEKTHQAYSSIKLFYKLVLQRESPYTLNKSFNDKKLPEVISHSNILRILGSIDNKKHRLILSLIYGSGLRVSEVVRIRISDLDLKLCKIQIWQERDNTNRISILSEKIIPELLVQINNRDGNEYLFLNRKNTPYSIRTIQAIFTKAVKRSGIQINGGCHSLRHSFATRLLETGTNIKSIKILLGHKSIKTTMRYTQVTDMLNQTLNSPL